jgi:hypothetical protein
LGQFISIGNTSFNRYWANLKPSMVVLRVSSGPSQGHRQHLVMGQPLASVSSALSQFISISITSPDRHWANLKPLMVLLRDSSGPSQGHWQYLVRGQPHATGSSALGLFVSIGITSFNRYWANLKPSMVVLRVSSGSSQVHRQYLMMGPPHAIGSNVWESGLTLFTDIGPT